jgi:hypothetical protein
VTGFIKRMRERRGTMPDNVRAELEAEGLELLEEKIPTSIIYRHYIVPGQRPTSGEQNTILAVGLTPKRLALRGTGNFLLDAKRGPVRSEVPEPGKLVLRYQAGDIYPTRAGEVEMTLDTPRAEDIHARLQAWTQTSTS